MSSIVTKEAPNFTAEAVMADGSIQEISLSDFRGQYVVLYFYPLDFTFVCPTEIIAFNKEVAAFEERHVQLIGVSVDSAFTHAAWRQTAPSNGGIGEIGYPLVADLKKSIARDYGVLFDDSVALRGLFLIDKEGVVRHAVVNDLPLGRSVGEAIRIVDALQYYEANGEVCPANWQKGDKAMKADAEGVAMYLKEQEG